MSVLERRKGKYLHEESNLKCNRTWRYWWPLTLAEYSWQKDSHSFEYAKKNTTSNCWTKSRSRTTLKVTIKGHRVSCGKKSILRSAKQPPVMNPDRIAFQASSFWRTPLIAQSNVENIPPHIPKLPPVTGARAFMEDIAPINRSPLDAKLWYRLAERYIGYIPADYFEHPLLSTIYLLQLLPSKTWQRLSNKNTCRIFNYSLHHQNHWELPKD